jgi:hypothetical protein
MRITCVTSRYLPNISHLVRLCEVDRAVVLDLAPLPHQNRDSFVTRNRIWNKVTSAPQWLTVPVLRGHGQSVRDTAINPSDGRWANRHIHALQHCYPRHEHFSPGFVSGLEAILYSGHRSLLQLNLDVLRYLLEVLGIAQHMPVLQSSLVGAHTPNHRVEVGECLSASEYVAGSIEQPLMAAPQQVAVFSNAGIRVSPSPPFQLDEEIRSTLRLSVVHFLCTQGVAATRELFAGLLAQVLVERPTASDVAL